MNHDYIICIPSYRRAKICNQKTLKTLNGLLIKKDCIKVFVVEDEVESYKAELNPEWYGELIVGVPGLVQQRQFITDYHPAGTRIISFDDDVECLDLSLTGFETADEFFRIAFERCENESAFIWSVYPVFNPFFRKSRIAVTTGITYAIGALYGYINRPDANDLSLPITKGGNKEDVERSIRYYLKDGKIIRFNRIGFKTKYYGTDGGGLGTFKDRLEKMKQNAIALNEAFPDLTRIKIRKNGLYEIVLREKPPKRTKKPPTPPPSEDVINAPIVLPECFDTDKILQMLESIKIPLCSHNTGRAKRFGKHHSMVLGYITTRCTHKYGLSKYTQKYPELYDEIVKLGNMICPFEFTSIHVNHNVQCPRHIDKGNDGLSTIISFGDYQGGELHVEDFGEYDTRNRPLLFDGCKHYHWNNPITSGNKYSLVFFATKDKSRKVSA